MIIRAIKHRETTTYRPKPELTFKSNGTGALIGWGAGLSTGLTIAIGAAISQKNTLPVFVNSLAIIAIGILGALLGEKIEKHTKKFDKSV